MTEDETRDRFKRMQEALQRETQPKKSAAEVREEADKRKGSKQ